MFDNHMHFLAQITLGNWATANILPLDVSFFHTIAIYNLAPDHRFFTFAKPNLKFVFEKKMMNYAQIPGFAPPEINKMIISFDFHVVMFWQLESLFDFSC